MAEGDSRSKLLQTRSDGGFANIGTGNPVPKIQQNFSNSAHADAADSDKVNVLDPLKHGAADRSPVRSDLQFAPRRRELRAGGHWFRFPAVFADYRTTHE